ncbi:hypothetical protein BT63DRAFT_453512 [Microthyrium microscopicum]|uniref:Ornithine decarboxylase antizyme n=1 Tax=Microthyrium microscopicum TaxID=703497 RepID=A0A6A6UHG2_9PEZI|nr:hypothetical protein BT63DRAFT_453512 [Microthyrium microscopicum]
MGIILQPASVPAATLSTLLLWLYPASITPLPALAGPSGIPEVGNDHGPPESPPLAAYAVSSTRLGAAAHYIRSECERFCCETLKAAFLGEGRAALHDSLVLDAQTDGKMGGGAYLPAMQLDGSNGSMDSNDSYMLSPAMSSRGCVSSFFELWDYVSGARFRGFIADKNGTKGLFVFFDRHAFGTDLKPGLMALLELCDVAGIDCSEAVICLDRYLEGESKAMIHDFGWAGFELSTLADWTDHDDMISERWIFLSMEV